MQLHLSGPRSTPLFARAWLPGRAGFGTPESLNRRSNRPPERDLENGNPFGVQAPSAERTQNRAVFDEGDLVEGVLRDRADFTVRSGSLTEQIRVERAYPPGHSRTYPIHHPQRVPIDPAPGGGPANLLTAKVCALADMASILKNRLAAGLHRPVVSNWLLNCVGTVFWKMREPKQMRTGSEEMPDSSARSCA